MSKTRELTSVGFAVWALPGTEVITGTKVHKVVVTCTDTEEHKAEVAYFDSGSNDITTLVEEWFNNPEESDAPTNPAG